MASAHCSSGFCNWSKDGCLKMHSSSSSSFFFPSYHCPFPYWLLMSRLHVTIEWNDGLLAITKQRFFFRTTILSVSIDRTLSTLHWVSFFPQMRFQLTHSTGAFCLWQVEKMKEKCIKRMNTFLVAVVLQLIMRQAQVLFFSLLHTYGEKDGKRDMKTYTDTHRQTDTHSERHSEPRSWSTLSSISWRTLLDALMSALHRPVELQLGTITSIAQKAYEWSFSFERDGPFLKLLFFLSGTGARAPVPSLDPLCFASCLLSLFSLLLCHIFT